MIYLDESSAFMMLLLTVFVLIVFAPSVRKDEGFRIRSRRLSLLADGGRCDK